MDDGADVLPTDLLYRHPSVCSYKRSCVITCKLSVLFTTSVFLTSFITCTYCQCCHGNRLCEQTDALTVVAPPAGSSLRTFQRIILCTHTASNINIFIYVLSVISGLESTHSADGSCSERLIMTRHITGQPAASRPDVKRP